MAPPSHFRHHLVAPAHGDVVDAAAPELRPQSRVVSHQFVPETREATNTISAEAATVAAPQLPDLEQEDAEANL
jgi:hypothetical protein